MSKKYPPMNKQIAEFPCYYLFCGRLVKSFIENTDSYNHFFDELHHYIKEEEYYMYPKRYTGMQKLILVPKQLHKDLHSAMSDARFYNKWKIERDLLLYRHRKADAGFWDKDGNYIEDIQEVDEMELEEYGKEKTNS